MKKLNNKGFTVIELTISFLFVFMIAFSMYQLLYNYRVRQNEESIKSQMIDYKNQVTLAIQNDINEKTLKYIDYCTEGGNRTSKCIVLHFNDNTRKQLSIEEREKVYDDIDEPQTVNYISYGGTVYESTDAVLLEFPSSQMLYKSSEIDNIEDRNVAVYKISIPIYHNDLEGNYGISIVAVGYNYNYSETPEDPIEGGAVDPSTIVTTSEGRVYNGYITIEPSTKIDSPTTSQTIIARLKFDEEHLDAKQQFLGNMQYGGSALSLEERKFCYGFYLYGASNVVDDFTGIYNRNCIRDNKLNVEADKFYTVIGVVNSDDANGDNGIKIYVYDDVGKVYQNNFGTDSGAVISVSHLNFAMGGNQGDAIHSNYFYGTISDALIYDVALGEETIANCINNGNIDRTCINTTYENNKKLDLDLRKKS